MIFTRTKRAAQRLADELEDRGFKATSIHGDLNQVAREKALKRFREGKVEVLVATDVAARGIDITDVSHVINFECPDSEMTYVHRIGRTGRAGAKGVAVTLVDWADVTRWKVINRALDLDFAEISETYSTSPHLFSDLGIPEGTRGRLVDAPPRERDDDKAAKVYADVQPLTAEDIADSVYWIATRPAHVNINTIELMPVAQSFAGLSVHRG